MSHGNWSNCHLSELFSLSVFFVRVTCLKLPNYADGTIELKLQPCCKLPFRMVTIVTKNILKILGISIANGYVSTENYKFCLVG